ncbi:MAG TPA: hypothetical protein P5571_01400 [Candidatus Krumholzibacteria bacterium]|nr:hypothetical protein [Candidatus Krumholzibacteria bacterium]HRX50012.1 hypothetical protein [Candidatus Krumholzibacteria bacterium]
MKHAIVATLLLLTVAAAQAGTIVDLQMGVYAIGDEITVTDAVVVALRSNGLCITEDPNAPYAGVWVYTGSAPGVAVGDLVDVKGLYEEYFDFTEINVSTDVTGYVTMTGVHNGAIYPLPVTVADIGEAYEGCFIKVTDGMTVTTAPNSFGEWVVESYETPGTFLKLDDYWYDDTTVSLGDCYNCATGVLIYSFGEYKLEPFADAICVTDCTVANETLGFGALKTLFR